jgi:hypothetical protein
MTITTTTKPENDYLRVYYGSFKTSFRVKRDFCNGAWGWWLSDDDDANRVGFGYLSVKEALNYVRSHIKAVEETRT